METTNKSGKKEIPSRTEAFVTFEKERLDDSKWKKNVTLCNFLQL